MDLRAARTPVTTVLPRIPTDPARRFRHDTAGPARRFRYDTAGRVRTPASRRSRGQTRSPLLLLTIVLPGRAPARGPAVIGRHDEPEVPLVHPQHRRAGSPGRRHDGRLGVDRVLDRPGPHGGGTRLERRPAGHRLGPPRNLHRGHGARRAHHGVRAPDRGASRLLAAGPARGGGCHPRPAQPRTGPVQHRQRSRRPRRLRRHHRRTGATVRTDTGVPPPPAASVDRGGRHVQRGVLPGDQLHGRPPPVRDRREDTPDALFRRRLPGGRTGLGCRGGRPALLGRATRRSRRTHRQARSVE